MKLYVDTDHADNVILRVSTSVPRVACIRITRCLQKAFGARYVGETGDSRDWVRTLAMKDAEVRIRYGDHLARELSLILPRNLGEEKLGKIQAELSQLRLWL